MDFFPAFFAVAFLVAFVTFFFAAAFLAVFFPAFLAVAFLDEAFLLADFLVAFLLVVLRGDVFLRVVFFFGGTIFPLSRASVLSAAPGTVLGARVSQLYFLRGLRSEPSLDSQPAIPASAEASDRALV